MRCPDISVWQKIMDEVGEFVSHQCPACWLAVLSRFTDRESSWLGQHSALECGSARLLMQHVGLCSSASVLLCLNRMFWLVSTWRDCRARQSLITRNECL